MFIKFISGKSTQLTYFIFIVLLWMSFGIVSYMAISVFPVQYNILNNHISNMGGIVHNPNGHQIWNTAIIIFGIISIPYYAFLYQYFKPNWPKLSKWILRLGISCAIGFALVGIFPEDIPIYHQIGAVLSLIGIVVLALLIQYIVYQNPSSVQSPGLITILNLLLWISFLESIFIFRLDEWFGLRYPPEPRIFDFPIWEWSYFLMVITWTISILIPMNKKNINNAN